MCCEVTIPIRWLCSSGRTPLAWISPQAARAESEYGRPLIAIWVKANWLKAAAALPTTPP